MRHLPTHKMADFTTLVVGILLIGVVHGQLDTTVCTPYQATSGSPMPPPPPNTFETHIEANINNRNYTVDYHVWYDKPNNRVATHIRNAGARKEKLFRFDTNEYFNVDRDMGVCRVTPLNTADQLYLFGKPVGNTAVMKTPFEFLNFNMSGTSYQYVNKTKIRGVSCNMWRSCNYWPNVKASFIAEHYFSDTNWMTSRLTAQLPVRVHIYGNAVDPDGKKRRFDHMYEFIDFHVQSTKGKSSFPYETPTGVYCPRAKNLKPLPTPTSAFHFTSEVIFGQTISRIKEWYDSDMSLVRYDYDPLGDYTWGTKPLTQVHDFNTGVAYVIDQLRGNCSAVPISSTGFDSRKADATHARIRTAKEFFYFDKGSYIYEGRRIARGIITDVWTAQRNDWPAPNSPNSTWSWYFATSNYTANLADVLSFGNPVRLTLKGGLGQYYVYNIYDYDERRPMIWSYDISKCFNYTSRQDFSFRLAGSYRSLVSGNMELFRYACLRAIVKAGTSNNMNLSPLRVFNIQIDFADNSDIIVMFTLLDKAPQIGSVSNPKPENNLAVVSKSISAAINGGQLIVKLQVPLKNTASMVAKKYSLAQTQNMIKNAYYQNVQTSSSSSGVSGGAMAGMGVALLVVFFVIGVAVTYVYYRKQGGAFGPKKFGDEDITTSES
ncbi:hypothetical protein ACF0H5_024074 [Mactra antiquata]